jgi:hypothetical protein
LKTDQPNRSRPPKKLLFDYGSKLRTQKNGSRALPNLADVIKLRGRSFSTDSNLEGYPIF